MYHKKLLVLSRYCIFVSDFCAGLVAQKVATKRVCSSYYSSRLWFEENNALSMGDVLTLFINYEAIILNPVLKISALRDIYIGATNIINNAWNDHVFWVCACLLYVSVMQILEWITEECTRIR